MVGGFFFWGGRGGVEVFSVYVWHPRRVLIPLLDKIDLRALDVCFL